MTRPPPVNFLPAILLVLAGLPLLLLFRLLHAPLWPAVMPPFVGLFHLLTRDME